MKIELELISLSGEEVSKVIDAYIEFTDIYFKRVVNYKAKSLKDFEDPKQGWTEEKHVYRETYILKSDLSMIDLSQTVPRNEGDDWFWVLGVEGYRTIDIYFKKSEIKKANEVKVKLLSWIGILPVETD